MGIKLWLFRTCYTRVPHAMPQNFAQQYSGGVFLGTLSISSYLELQRIESFIVKDRTARLYLTMALLSNTTTTSVEDRLALQLKNTQKLEVTSLDTAIAQLQTEVAEVENHEKNLVEEKRKQEQESLQHKVEQDVQQLEAIAAHINALASQLEAEMLGG